MSAEIVTVAELRERLVRKAAADEALRARLLGDPTRVVEKELGLTILDGFTVKVHEERGDTSHVQALLQSMWAKLHGPHTDEMSARTTAASAPRSRGSRKFLLRGETPIVGLADRHALRVEEHRQVTLFPAAAAVPQVSIEVVPDHPAAGAGPGPAKTSEVTRGDSRRSSSVEVLAAGEDGCAPSAFTFDDLVRPLTAREFLDTRCGERPVLFRGRSARFASLCTWDDLNALLSSPVCRTRMQLWRDGKQISDKLCTTPPFGPGWRNEPANTDQLDDGRLNVLLRDGASVVLRGIQAFHPRSRPVADALESALGSYANINLYASWMPTRGFAAHWDDHDVFILQVAGRKRWQLYGETRRFPLIRDAEPNPRPGEAVWSEVIDAGDVLYIPRGWWHDARVAGNDGAAGVGSLHFTCSVRPLTGLDFLSWLSGRLARHEAFRRDLPHPADGAGEDHYAALGRLVLGELRGDVGRRFRDHLRSTWSEPPRTNLGPHIEPWRSPDWSRYRIRLRGGARASLRRDAGGDAVLEANGYRRTFDGRCMGLLEHLVRDGAVSVGALRASAAAAAADEDPASFADEFARLLVARGIAHAVPPALEPDGSRAAERTEPASETDTAGA